MPSSSESGFKAQGVRGEGEEAGRLQAPTVHHESTLQSVGVNIVPKIHTSLQYQEAESQWRAAITTSKGLLPIRRCNSWRKQCNQTMLLDPVDSALALEERTPNRRVFPKYRDWLGNLDVIRDVELGPWICNSPHFRTAMDRQRQLPH